MSAALLAAQSLPAQSNSTASESFSIIDRAWKSLEAQVQISFIFLLKHESNKL
jgi:hypothetical protein